MEKLKDTKMSDLSDFDDRTDDRDNIEKAGEAKTEVIKTRSSSDSSCSNSSSGDQANGEQCTQICSSEEGDCCVSPLLGPDSSPEVSVTPGQQCGDQVAGV